MKGWRFLKDGFGPFAAFCLLVCLVLAAGAGWSEEMRKIKIGAPGRGVSYLPLVVASEVGFAREAGLTVGISVVSQSAGLTGTASGELDYYASGIGVFYGAAAGIPVKVLAILTPKPQHALVAKRGLFHSPRDLKGKTIASVNDDTPRLMLAQAFSSVGLDWKSDVKIVNIGEPVARFAALDKGIVDAAWLDLVQSVRAQQQGYEIISNLADLSDVFVSSLVSSERKLRAEPEEIKRFLRVVVLAAQYVKDKRNRERVAGIISSWSKIPKEIASQVYDVGVASYSATGIPPEATLRTIRAGVQILGLKLDLDTLEQVSDYSLISSVTGVPTKP